MESISINTVAIYLRKSRDEDMVADLLSKHRATLVSLAQSKEWQYTIYEEQARSGEELATRDILMGLLQKIEQEPTLYDAILVMDWDRLSRGESPDFSKIKRLLIYSKTLLVTTEGIYDLSRNGDAMVISVKAMVANSELQQTKKRFKEGKMSAAKKGRFANGDAPFPYIKKYIYADKYGNKIEQVSNESDDEYRTRIFKLVEDHKAKIDFEIIVDENKREIYDFIKNSFLYQGMSLSKIVQKLNNDKVPTMYCDRYPNATWAVTTIRRILENKVHCGYYCFNKRNTKYLPLADKHIIVNNNVDDWIIGKSDHEILKTEDEHQQIMKLLDQNQDFPKKSIDGKFIFSSLIYCKKCGRSMVFQKNNRPNKKDGYTYYYVACHRALIPKCPQIGCRVDNNFNNTIINKIIEYLEYNIKNSDFSKDNGTKNVEKQIEKNKSEIRKNINALNKIKRAYEEDIYTSKEYQEAKDFRENEIEKLNKRNQELENQQSLVKIAVDYSKILSFLKVGFNDLEEYQKNAYLKTFLKKVWYDRVEKTKNVTLEIELI